MNTNRTSVIELRKLVKEVSLLSLEISYNAQAGHIGSCLSIADLVTLLYFAKMNIRMSNLKAKNRDRFILSKGHAAAVLYSVLYKKGIITKEALYSFGKDNGGLCEHPEIFQKGIEMTTGSLGHGLPFGTGIAHGLKMQKQKSNVYVLVSDGECGEGSVWEAALLASRLRLDNLTVIVDYNNWQCFGKSDLITNLPPFAKKWEAFGWEVSTIDGHNIQEILQTVNKLPFKKNKPSVIIARTISGRGVSIIEDKLIGHYKIFSKEEYENAKKEIHNL